MMLSFPEMKRIDVKMGVLCLYHLILPRLEVDGLTEVGRTKLCYFICSVVTVQAKCVFKLALTTEINDIHFSIILKLCYNREFLQNLLLIS